MAKKRSRDDGKEPNADPNVDKMDEDGDDEVGELSCALPDVPANVPLGL